MIFYFRFHCLQTWKHTDQSEDNMFIVYDKHFILKMMVNQKQPSNTLRSVEDIWPFEILKRIGAVA